MARFLGMPMGRVRRVAKRLLGRRRLSRAMRGVPELRGLRLRQMLQARQHRPVALADLKGRPVIVKLNGDPEFGTPVTARGWEILQAAYPRMNSGPYQVPEPIFAAPERGLLVMSVAPGHPLAHALATTSDAETLVIARHVLAWLRVFIDDHTRPNTFAAGYWVKTARDRDIIPDLAPLSARLLPTLEAQQGPLQNRAITQVRSHGDLWAKNILWDGAVMTGIDLQYVGWQPIERDVARFLVHARLIRPQSQGPLRYGLPEAWLEVFEPETHPDLLRYFIGLELHRWLVPTSVTAGEHVTLGEMIDAYLSEPG